MAHLKSCDECPGHCCWRAVSNEEPAELDSKAAEDRHHQLHYSTAYMKGMFFACIDWRDVIIDVLHVILRIVPAIYRVTVSAHIDSTECQSLAQWIFHTHRVVVASNTAVQSATGKEGNVGNECWPGNVCNKLLDIYPEVLVQVHQRDSEIYTVNEDVWDSFWEFQAELVKGCDDNDADDVERHAATLQSLAETFVNNFIKASSSEKVTPYMHCIMVDVPRLVRRHGSLVKYSSQGVQRLHQWVKFVTQHRCNKRYEDTAKTCISYLTRKGSVNNTQEAHRTSEQARGRKRRVENQFTKPGGNLSKKQRDQKEEAIERTEARIQEKKVTSQAAAAGPLVSK